MKFLTRFSTFAGSRQLQLISIVLVAIALIVSSNNLLDAFRKRSEVIDGRENAFLVSRPFQRLQREVLNLSVIVAGGDEGYTVNNLQLQRDITASRFFDINTGVTLNRLTPELLEVLHTSESQWDALQSDLDAYVETGLHDEALRTALNVALKEMELAVNVADHVHTIKIDQLDEELLKSEDRLTLAQIRSVILLVLLLVLIASAIILRLQKSAAEIRLTNQQLHERTEQLDLTNHELENANRLKSEFLATMSHELRTPLNAILGYTGLLRLGIRGKVDEEAKGIISQVEESGKNLLNLINDILDIAKIESGRMELLFEQVDLRVLVDSWSNELKVLADGKGLDFQSTIDQNLPATILGDRERLTQIANNLLSNAIKFTEKGSVNLNVGRDNGVWFIQVSDTGKGIPPDAQEYIFDEFRQVDGSYSRVFGGTGLGLSIVRKLALSMGGNVQLQSKTGQGSTFSVRLPLKDINGKGEGA